MTAKALLERIIKIRKAIDYRRTKIDTLIEQAENTSARLTGMPHNPRSDAYGKRHLQEGRFGDGDHKAR